MTTALESKLVILVHDAYCVDPYEGDEWPFNSNHESIGVSVYYANLEQGVRPRADWDAYINTFWGPDRVHAEQQAILYCEQEGFEIIMTIKASLDYKSHKVVFERDD